MAGSWDFTVIAGKTPHPIALEANLTQDGSGNISGPGSVTANGPAGNVLEADIVGSSLATAANISVDYLGFTCTGTDSGDRSITGTINSSNQVTLALDIGGTEVDTITGTLNTSANPPFSGTMSTSGICGGPGTVSVTGAPASFPPMGAYGGTSAFDNTVNISVGHNRHERHADRPRRRNQSRQLHSGGQYRGQCFFSNPHLFQQPGQQWSSFWLLRPAVRRQGFDSVDQLQRRKYRHLFARRRE